MSLRKEQCKKVCRILDDVLANRPTERDSLIVAVRKAFAQFATDTNVGTKLSTNLVEVGKDVPDTNVGELISRQAAIDEEYDK